MKNEKRLNKGYKCKDTVYKKALKRCKGTPLATLIEQWVTGISEGKSVVIFNKPEVGGTIKVGYTK